MEEEMKEGGNQDLRRHLRISPSALKEVNQFLLDTDNSVINGLLRVVEKYGTPEEINAKARRARKLSNLLKRLQVMKSPYLKDLEWLMAERDKGCSHSGNQRLSIFSMADHGGPPGHREKGDHAWTIYSRSEDEGAGGRPGRYPGCGGCHADRWSQLCGDP
jgi:hypothetical protein